MIQKIIFACIAACAMAVQAEAEELFQGFNLNGAAINPICIQNMRPWMSDSGLIIKSIVLEQCQNSNWGFHKNPVTVTGNSVEAENEKGSFSYEVIGKTTSGLFLLFHEGDIAAYQISTQNIRPDLFKQETQNVHILTAVGDSFVPCFKKGRIEGDTIVIEKNIFDQNAPHSEQCKEKIETVTYEIAS